MGDDEILTPYQQKSVLLEEKFPESIQPVLMDKAIQTEAPSQNEQTKAKPAVRKYEENVQTEVSMSDI